MKAAAESAQGQRHISKRPFVFQDGVLDFFQLALIRKTQIPGNGKDLRSLWEHRRVDGAGEVPRLSFHLPT